MPLERSHLAVPGSNWRMIQKATTLDADVAFLDLEDAVAPDAKCEARSIVARALHELDWRERTRVVRVNALDTPWFYRDLIDIGEGGNVDRVILPKVNRPEDVYVAATLLDQIEMAMALETRIGLHIQIESAEGVANVRAIAQACDRVEALVLGPGDLAASLGMPVESIGGRDGWDDAYGADRWQYVMSAMLIAARAAGIRAIDGPVADYNDTEALRQAAMRARALGFDGKWCIHPSQIEIVNEVFTPTDREVAWARRVVEAYESSASAGRGATVVDGHMIDAASVRMARRTIEEADAAIRSR